MLEDWRNWTPEMVAEHNARVRGHKSTTPLPSLPPGSTSPSKAGESVKKGKKGANKTEMAAFHYLTQCYRGARIRYEAITFHLQAEAAYTPDWLVSLSENDTMICVEVKNAAYKHASYGRSRLAFRQAALEFPQFQFIWLELRNNEWVLN
jgi:hypothetical protein